MSLPGSCQLHSLLSHSHEGSPHTPPIHKPGRKAWGLLWSPQPALARAQSACSPHRLTFSCPPPLAFTDPQGATFLPTCSSQSLVQPWPKGTESSASSPQQAHLLPFAHPSQLQGSAVISWCQCGAVHRNLHWALSDRDTLRAGGKPRALGMLLPCTGAASQLGCSCFSSGHSAAPLLLTGFLWEKSL